MNKMVSPFTMTPGIAGNARIETHFSDEIIANFESKESYKYLYKILGLRGSGKSVEYTNVMNHFSNEDKWLVYSLAAGGNPIQALISELSKEKFIDNKAYSQSVGGTASMSADVGLLSADADINAAISIRDNENYYSDESELKTMLKKATMQGYRVLVGIDDISKTDEVVRFLSVLGNLILDPRIDIRFICTGLSKNIEDFVKIPNLSFFVRNEGIKMKPLDYHSMAQKYRQLLSISHEDAVLLSRFTKGYAYGYQLLGELCFKHNKSVVDNEIETEFDEAIGPQYDLLWTSLTDAEQKLVKIIVNTESGNVSEIKEKMEGSSGFNSLRERIFKKHMLISPSRGKVEVPLPRFKEYVELWH